MKKHQYTTFIRWGDLNLVKQDGYSTNPSDWTFHSPPARYGLYAFPETIVEKFLLGKSHYVHYMHEIVKRDLTKEELLEIINDISHNNSDVHLTWRSKKDLDEWLDLLDKAHMSTDERNEFQRKHCFLIRKRRPKKFNYSGNIWHHLDNKLNHKMIIKRRGAWVLTSIELYIKQFKREFALKQCLQLSHGWNVDNDHMEVFIPEKI